MFSQAFVNGNSEIPQNLNPGFILTAAGSLDRQFKTV